MAVPEKANEITAIPDLLDQLAEGGKLKGALVTIDAIGCQVDIADKIVAREADDLLALKGNQPNLEAEVAALFSSAPKGELLTLGPIVEKGHGRIETREYDVCDKIDWIVSDRSYPGAPRFKTIKSLLRVRARVEHANRCTQETRYFISSAAPDVERLAARRARPLGRREQPLAARCRLQGGYISLQARQRRKKHGRHAPLRAWPGARQQSEG